MPGRPRPSALQARPSRGEGWTEKEVSSMRLTGKDAKATLLVVTAVVLYVPFLAGAKLPLVSGPRVLAPVVLGLGIAACIVNGSEISLERLDLAAGRWVKALAWLATLALVATVVTLITGSAISLAALVGAVVVMWLLTTVRHAVVGRPILSNRGDGSPPCC